MITKIEEGIFKKMYKLLNQMDHILDNMDNHIAQCEANAYDEPPKLRLIKGGKDAMPKLRSIHK